MCTPPGQELNINSKTKSNCVCVPTDNTNSTRVIKIEEYKRLVSECLQKAANLAIRPKVMALFEDANLLLEKGEDGIVS